MSIVKVSDIDFFCLLLFCFRFFVYENLALHAHYVASTQYVP